MFVHGLGGAAGVFVRNMLDLAEKRTVYAIDLLGFGISGRQVKTSKHVTSNYKL